MLSNRFSLSPPPKSKVISSLPTPEICSKVLSREGYTGDTFSLVNDAIRLQRSIEKTIASFKFTSGFCCQLLSQLEICEDFLSDLLQRYERERLALESQNYFSSFMEYTEALNKASEFVQALKDKNALTRFKNREKYRKAIRVLSLELGKAVQHLQALLSIKKANHAESSNASFRTMATITGTLRLLRAQVFSDEDSCSGSVNSEFNEQLSQLIHRRKIRRHLDHPLRIGLGCIVYKATYDGITVAEKVYSDIDSKFLKEIQQEVSRWMKLRSYANVGYIYGLWVEGSSVGVLSDYYVNDNLNQLITRLSSEKATLAAEVRIRLSLELAKLIAILHEQEVALGGIHLHALFMNQEGTLELGSFESLAHRLLGEFPGEYIGFAAPEILQNRFGPSAPTLASDIYSAGVILGSIWCTALPYAARIKREFVLKGGKPDWINRLPQALAPIITLCLEFKPSSRPSAIRLLTTLENVFADDDFANESIPGQAEDSPAVSTGGSELSLNKYCRPRSALLMEGIYCELMPCGRPLVRRSVLLQKTSRAPIGRSLSLRSIDRMPLLDKALALYNEEDHENAFNCFVQLIECESDPIANYYLGLYYYYGKGTFLNQNISKALVYLQRAATQNHGDALDLLGVYYLDPTMGKCNYEMAFIHFQKAAAVLSPGGCFHLSQCYKYGQGTPCQPDLASYALQLSASLGYGPAIALLKNI